MDTKEHYKDYGAKEEYKREFLKEQTKCNICGAVLDIVTESLPYHTKEEARCSQCMALQRVESHILH